MIYLRYGAYRHELNEANVAITVEHLFTARRVRWATEQTWTITGVLMAASPAQLTLKIRRLKAAYRLNRRDVGLYFSNHLPTTHRLLSRHCLGGVKVLRGPDFLEGPGEYTTFRTYRIVLRGRYRNSQPQADDDGQSSVGAGGSGGGGGGGNPLDGGDGGSDPQLWSYTESVSTQGNGGPLFVVHTPRLGACIRQQVSESSPIVIVQSGEAVGMGGPPPVPPPLLPALLDPGRSSTVEHSPETDGDGLTRCKVTWNYVFNAISPQTVRPTNR